MKIIEHWTKIPENMAFTAIDSKYKNGFFMDIETTGFTAKYNFIYLIGCGFIKNNLFCTQQYIIENQSEEVELLHSFNKLLHQFDSIITFNGTRFDLPFLIERGNFHNITITFLSIHHLDLFSSLKPYKKILQLSSLKQKNIEIFLEIERKDAYNGGELIPVYLRYEHTHQVADEQLLLLHNYEDVMGMVDLLPTLAYKQLNLLSSASSKQITYETLPALDNFQQSYVILTFTMPYSFAIPIHYRVNKTVIWATKYMLKFMIPITDGPMKLFYSDYKNYVYLSQEKYAIHKSVGQYVDPEYRQPAKASTCYSLVDGPFIPSYGYTKLQFFGENYKTRESYIQLSELNNPIFSLDEYLSCLVKAI